MKNPLRLVEADRDLYYWHTEQDEYSGGWLLFKDDELIYHTTDDYEAHSQYDWQLWGGTDYSTGKPVEVKGLLEYPNTFEENDND